MAPVVRPTGEQEAATAAARRLGPGQVLKVIAYAGAGKTSTLEMIASALGGRGLYASFNKSIAASASTRFPAFVDCKTLHAVAFHALALRGARVGNLDGGLVEGLLDDGWPDTRAAHGVTRRTQARLCAAAVRAYCHSAGPAPEPQHLEQVLDQHVYLPPLQLPPPGQARDQHLERMAKRRAIQGMLERQVPRAVQALATSQQRGGDAVIPHDIYLKTFERDPALIRRKLGHYDFILLDEAQDLSPVMRSIAVRSGARVIAVGDPRQQIYAWRGAENALALLDGRETYLSQSFRFGPAIAEVAMHIVHSKPGERLPVPLVGAGGSSRVVTAGKPDAVLCRGNAGVFRMAMGAAQSGKSAHIVGGLDELAGELRSAQALHEGRRRDITDDRFRRFTSWADLKDEAAMRLDATLSLLVEVIEKGLAAGLPLLERAHVASESAADLVLSTVHKAKGREWDAVQLHDDFPDLQKMRERHAAALRSGRAEAVTSALEEWNVLYVAVTRARRTLILPAPLAHQLRLQPPSRDAPWYA